MIEIRKTRLEDVSACAAIYDRAREFMKSVGNKDQWAGGYPNADDVINDIALGASYVVTEGDKILAVFYFRVENDPTYERIFEGEWLDNSEYAVIHRVAVAEAGKGIVGRIFDYCYAEFPHLRIDTHRLNAPMLRALRKNGFSRRGMIYLSKGDERIAFEKI